MQSCSYCTSVQFSLLYSDDTLSCLACMMTKRSGKQSALSAQQTRDTILGVAANLFAQYGYSAVTVRQISEQAGVSHSLLRHHFGNKQQVWQGVILALHQRLNSYVLKLKESAPAQLPSNQLLFYVLERLMAFLIVEQRPLLLLADAMKQPAEMSQFILNLNSEAKQMLDALVEACKREGYLTHFVTGEIEWLIVLLAHAPNAFAPMLNKPYPDTATAEQRLKHWQMTMRLIAPHLNIPDAAISQPAQLESLVITADSSLCSLAPKTTC